MIEPKKNTRNVSRGPEASAVSAEDVKQTGRKNGCSNSECQRPMSPERPDNVGDRKTLDRFIARLKQERKPTGIIEEVLIERIAVYAIRMKGGRLVEEDLIRAAKAEDTFSLSNQHREARALAAFAAAFPKGKEVNDASVKEAFSRAPFLEQLLAEPRPETHSVVSSSCCLHLLRRFQQYDTGLQVGFLNAVRQLDRFQAMRTQARRDKKSSRSRPKS
jgi:hypothetical protein